MARSRNRLPRSHEVSEANWQAWQAAPWTDAVRARVVLGAQRVGRAELRALERLAQQRPEVLGLAEADEAAERALAVGAAV